MKRSILSIFVALLAVSAIANARVSELLSQEDAELLDIVWRGNATEVSSHDLLEDVELPDEFTWCDKDGVNYCTVSLNQHIPQYCGSCWAHGSVSALADRVKIARKAQGPDILPSVQHILNCGNVGSCHGGTVDGPYQWLHGISEKTGSGISYFTSNPYLACSSESQEGMCPQGDWTCSAENVARTCVGDSCVGLKRYPNITISDYGSISGTSAMQKEIFNRGPIACGIDATKIEDYTSGIAKGWSFMVDHVISVVGWGKDDNEGQYWIVRNSWGEYWGENGYIRVKFGSLAVAQQCSWAVVDTYSAPELDNEVHCTLGGDCSMNNEKKENVVKFDANYIQKLRGVQTEEEEEEEEVEIIVNKRKNEIFTQEEVEKNGHEWRGNATEISSHELLEDGDIPDEFTWCDKDGENFCTISLNQHIPQYCGSCWAHGALSALQDRIKISRKDSGIDVQLSVQHLLNCGTAGSCHGGSSGAAYQWIKKISDATGSGISYTTGQPYLACSTANNDEGLCKGLDFTCTPENVARTCGTFGQECVGLSNYPNATVTDFGSISGKDAMMKEIFNRGPIACGVDAGPIANYTGGIVTAKSDSTDHAISVVGWGKDDKEGQYWIVRNSWGEYWGENGYVRVAFGAINIESGCDWAVPGTFTTSKDQTHCYEDGSNCKSKKNDEIFDSDSTHYEDPKNGCLSDEVKISIQDISGDMCSPACTGIFDMKCPSDVPSGVTATPTCALQDASTNKKYCALLCSPTTDEESLRAGDSQCGENASCKAIQGTGICTYDD